jgi:sporulation protein YunB
MKGKRKNYHLSAVNIYKLRKKDKCFAFLLLFFIFVILYIRYLALPVVINNTDAQLRSFATKSINYAVADTMNQNVSYGDIITVIKDGNNDVSYIESNSVRINLLSKNMSKVVMANFLELSKRPVKISLGSFSGIAVLSGVGPKVAFEVNPYGEVLCSFRSNFESAGINQTYHKLYLIISIKVNVVFPFQKLQVDSASEVLLCETLIIGKIPEVYLNSGNLTEMLNLVPSKFTS